MRLGSLLLTLAVCLRAHAAFLADLKQRSVYQIMTDRFARGDGKVTFCDPADKAYCGGDWRGIIKQLDYIQQMGFDTSA